MILDFNYELNNKQEFDMSFNLDGKIALVTGANRGIGEGFVQTLLKGGARKIYAAARDIKSLESVVALNPAVIEAVQLDVTQTEQITALAEYISDLDILVNNAGIIDPALSSALDATEFARKEMEVNLFGPMQLTSLLIPKLKQSRQGAIINLSSIAAISNFPSIGTYSISKAAMHSYSEGLRADLVNDGVMVACVYPGPTDTRMAAGMDMDKPAAVSVSQKAFAALSNNQFEVFPDDFAKQMYATFLEQPQKLAKVFSEMG
jgi:NAD(P)-dependent dehydrogenase (short-subunit alcohol dehydrogenase family)